jgi:hypothetical protein
LAWLIFCLTLLMTLANFGDFLFGDRIIKPVRDAAFRMYLKIEEGDWSPAYQVPAEIILSYARRILRTDGGPGIAVLWIVYYSLFINGFMSIVVYYVYTLYSESLRPGATVFMVPAFFMLFWSLPGNLLGDIIAWPSALWLLKRLRASTPVAAVLLLTVAVLLLYCLAVLATASRVLIQDLSLNYLEANMSHSDILRALLDALPTSIRRAWFAMGRLRMLSLADLLAIMQVMLPILLFFLVSIIGLLIYASRGPMRRPLIFLLERIEASPKSILTLGAAVLSALATLLAAWLKATPS